MSEQTPRLVPVPCVECGRPSVVQAEITHGNYVPLCFAHFQQSENLRMRQIQMYGELAAKAEDDIADIFGLPRKPRPMRIPAPRLNVQQINIHGDNLGVVNTGTVGRISNNLTIINGQDPHLANALKDLTERVIASTALDHAQKAEAAELLNDVVAEAAKTCRPTALADRHESRRRRAQPAALALG